MKKLIEYTLTVQSDNTIRATANDVPAPDGQLDEDCIKLSIEYAKAASKNILETDGLRDLGKHLYCAVFAEPIGGHFREQALRKVLEDAEQDTWLRLRLVFQQNVCPEIVSLPWEFLYGEEAFLSTHPRIALSYEYDDWLTRSLSGYPRDQLPLRVLFVHTHPSDLEGVGVIPVRQAIEELDVAQAKFNELADPSPKEIQEKLQNYCPHVFHFLGHGEFSEPGGAFALLNADGQALWYDNQSFSNLFHAWRPRLVVLQSCAGGQMSALQPFVGGAAWLVRQHIPAVVAMRYPFAQGSGWVFAQKFYETLASGKPVDMAVQAGRFALAMPEDGLPHSSRDFGAPVLWMRLRDGYLFAERESEKSLKDSHPQELPEVALRSKYSIPFRDDIPVEYFGSREKYYEEELKCSKVVSIWGEPGIGKTWVGAKLAIKLEEAEPSRQVLWIECTRGGFYKLASDVADCLSLQGEDSLRSFLRGRDKEQAPPASDAINLLVGLLNQRRYLLCFDDFHRVSSDPNVQSLLRQLVKRLRADRTKVILIGQCKPIVTKIGGRELENLGKTDIKKLVQSLEVYDKEWLDEKFAEKIAEWLIVYFDGNLKSMEMDIDWLRRNTTPDEVEDHFKSLDKTKIAERLLEGRDKAQRVLFYVLSMFEDWEKYSTSTLFKLVDMRGADKTEATQALKELLQTRLVEKSNGGYRLHNSVRKLVRERQKEQQVDLSDLHRYVADIHSEKGYTLSAVNHYLKSEVFTEAIQHLADNTIEVTRGGEAQVALDCVLELYDVIEDSLDEREGLWVYVLRGDLHAWLGQTGSARSVVRNGLDFLAGLSDQGDPEVQYLEGRLRLRLGTILMDEGRLPKAINQFTESEKLMRGYVQAGGVKYHASRTHEWLKALYNLGGMYWRIGVQDSDKRTESFKQAIQSYKKCIQKSAVVKSGERRAFWAGWGSLGLSRVYGDRNGEGDWERAVKAANDSLENFQHIHQWGIGHANYALGTLYLRLGKNEEAGKYLRDALEAANNCGDREVIILSNAELAKISRHGWTTAAEYLNTAQEMLDKTEIEWLSGYVSLLQHWIEGIRLLQEGEEAEGETALQDVLSKLRERGHEYGPEIKLVKEDLKAFERRIPPAKPSGTTPSPPVKAPPPPDTATTPTLGDHIGRYEIQEELGSGAMGIVYKAYDPNVGRPVALKVLIPGPHAQEMEQRFRREAQAAGNLSHPNIVTVHDAGVDRGRWYIVMECLEGKALSEIITQEGPQSLDWVTNIVVQVCDALSYAHDRQVIHRDIKPSNIMVLDDAQIKVADFGLASVAAEADLTKSGQFLGTPRYASPEQILDSKQVDGRSDIFSLGAVVYELLTGESLFPGEHITPIHHITSPEPADLSKLSTDLPDSIRQVLEKALAKDADERFSTCVEFSEAFVHAAQDADIPSSRDLVDAIDLSRQLTEARENLQLIQERTSEYVLSTNVPLQLVKEKNRLEKLIADLEMRLGKLDTTLE